MYDINSLLLNLYNKFWQNYLSDVRDSCSEPAAFPFLIEAERSYISASNRVMLCGQETQGWCNEYDTQTEPVSIEQVCKVYRDFVWNNGYNSPYWGFIKALKENLPEAGYVINNIVKIGRRYDPGCNDDINEKARTHFPVNREEFRILNPNKIVFLTGPNYDWRIQEVLGPFTKKRVNDKLKCLDILTFEDPSLPQAIRCYHPAYLRRRSLTTSYLDEIIKFCK